MTRILFRIGLLVAVVVLAVLPAPASATPTNYTTIGLQGNEVPWSGSFNLVSQADDDAVVVNFPFPLDFYGFGYSSGYVDTNGLVSFGGPVTTPVNSCIPSTALGDLKSIAVYWDDLWYPNSGEGVYTSVSGTAPHRAFRLLWEGQEFSTGATVGASLTFYEDATTLKFSYAAGHQGTGSGATVGLQADTFSGDFTQAFCNTAFFPAGDQIDWYWDDTGPVMTKPPTPQLVAGSQVASDSTVPLNLSWLGTDPESGVNRYQIQRALTSTTYEDLFLGNNGPVSLTPGYYYPYRGRAYNNAGIVGAWAKGKDTRLNLVQETASAITYSGTWTRNSTSSTSFLGGFEKASTASGASATFTCSNCRGVGWVSREDSTRGSAKIYVDGTLITTKSSYQATAKDRVVIYTKSWGSRGTHTLRLVNAGTSGHSKVGVDAFLGL